MLSKTILFLLPNMIPTINYQPADKISAKMLSQSCGPRTSHFPTMAAAERQTKRLTYLYIHNCVHKKVKYFLCTFPAAEAKPGSSHVCLAGTQNGQLGRGKRSAEREVARLANNANFYKKTETKKPKRGNRAGERD